MRLDRDNREKILNKGCPVMTNAALIRIIMNSTQRYDDAIVVVFFDIPELRLTFFVHSCHAMFIFHFKTLIALFQAFTTYYITNRVSFFNKRKNLIMAYVQLCIIMLRYPQFYLSSAEALSTSTKSTKHLSKIVCFVLTKIKTKTYSVIASCAIVDFWIPTV